MRYELSLFTAPSTPSLWAVYERADGCGYVVCPLRACPDGTYAPRVTPGTPDILVLPMSVHTRRSAADRAAALYLYDCAGTS
jgi:hypothetical protein